MGGKVRRGGHQDNPIAHAHESRAVRKFIHASLRPRHLGFFLRLPQIDHRLLLVQRSGPLSRMAGTPLGAGLADGADRPPTRVDWATGPPSRVDGSSLGSVLAEGTLLEFMGVSDRLGPLTRVIGKPRPFPFPFAGGGIPADGASDPLVPGLEACLSVRKTTPW